MAQSGRTGNICMKRTRRRLVNLVWSVLFLLAGASLLVYAASLRPSDGAAMARAVVAAALGIAALAAGVYSAFTALRDCFFPSKSRLARSIRSQLPHPDEAPPVRELFEAVDRDIRENGMWFDRVAVGREWILGDDATYIPRVRAVFSRDEVSRRASGSRTAGQIVQIYILDDRKQLSASRMQNPNELRALVDCLKLKAPDALYLPYKQLTAYASRTEEEWAALNREFEARRASRRDTAPDSAPDEDQSMVFTRPDGTDTSRVTEDAVTSALRGGLRSEDETLFTLSPTTPRASGAIKLSFLQCSMLGVDDPDLDEEDLKDLAEIYLIAGVKPEAGSPPETAFALECGYDEAERVLLDWFHGQAPEVSGWMPISIRAASPPRRTPEPKPPRLALASASGVLQSHESFQREDVEAAAEGLNDGTYKTVDLTLPGGYLLFRVEADGGQCTVTATNDVGGRLRFYRLECSVSQASRRMLDYFDNKLRPKRPEWRDITRQIEKEIGKEM